MEYIDVFSGIGGISYALKDFAKVIQYCEWDKYCQQVLSERMQDGSLDMASCHGDIKTMHVSPTLKPVMIAGGFPCQDISSLGNKRGIADGQRSGMFYEIMRIIDENPTIRVVFLENVGNITHCGMKEVIEELTARDFDFQWIMRSAGAYGAPHQRMRWFCLGIKRGTSDPFAHIDPTLLVPNTEVNRFWAEEPCPRVTFRKQFIGTSESQSESQTLSPVPENAHTDPNWIARYHTLGNSVVPVVVKESFKELVNFHKQWPNVKELYTRLSGTRLVREMTYPFPDHGIVLSGVYYALPPLLSNTVDMPRHSVDIRVKFNDTEMLMQNYPTPRRGNTHASSLTDRSLRDLPTILVYSNKTAQYLQDLNITIPTNDKLHNHLIANVNYVEWMMGYREDWTKVSQVFNPPTATLLRNRTAAAAAVVASSDEDDIINVIVPGTTPLRVASRIAPAPRVRNRSTASTSTTNRYKLNGMHILMKDNPGKDVKLVAQMWRSLTLEEKATYTARALIFNNN